MNSDATFIHQKVPRPVNTVQGPIPYDCLGITDAHNHLWIEPVPGSDPSSPVLEKFDLISKDLLEYRKSGGGSILDCQPPGCGRDANRLLALSIASGVHLIACTGFHRKKYYASDFWLWRASAQQICEFLCFELETSLSESLVATPVIKAGFIKIALEGSWSDCPQAALEGAACAALKTGALVEVHTEKGALAERACVYFTNMGLRPEQLVLCHMDKRPDLGLQKELARLGVLLEYDTFYRPKYNPSTNLWPLIGEMVKSGFDGRIALATDMAEAELYHHIGGGPGLASLPGQIRAQLSTQEIPQAAQENMLGNNIARRLGGLS